MKVSAMHPILVVEDSPVDFEIAVRAFRKTNVVNPIYHCSDGDEALDFLHRRGQYRNQADAPRPALILLDLNMPGTDGRELLAEIKHDVHFRRIPVVVLTTSADEGDVNGCYLAGANSYIQKPVDMAEFVEIVQNLKRYWFEIVQVPQTW